MSEAEYFLLEDGTSPRGLVSYRAPPIDGDLLWGNGERFTRAPSEQPLRPTVDLSARRKLLDLWKVPLPMMSVRLRDALLKAGVTTLDFYPVQLSDSRGAPVGADYVAFNVTAKGSVQQLAAKNVLLARLSSGDLVVHEAVVAHLEGADFDGLEFDPV